MHQNKAQSKEIIKYNGEDFCSFSLHFLFFKNYIFLTKYVGHQNELKERFLKQN